MKNPFKHEHTPKGKPSQERKLPTTLPLRDLTNADLEQVQGATVQHGDFHIQKYVDKASPKLS